MWAAAESPQLVSGLVLIGPFVRNTPVGAGAMLAFRLALLRPWGVSAWSAYYAAQYPGTKPADLKAHQAKLRDNLRRPGHWRAFTATTHTSHEPAEARLAEVPAPALVLMGDRDRDFRDPEAEARLVAGRLRGRFVMVPGAGHYPQAQFPEVVGREILGFLGGIEEPGVRSTA